MHTLLLGKNIAQNNLLNPKLCLVSIQHNFDTSVGSVYVATFHIGIVEWQVVKKTFLSFFVWEEKEKHPLAYCLCTKPE
jgi:hypothetical protein